jgi:NADPH:quinone reductase-like Zn-dependent oxidoreductase
MVAFRSHATSILAGKYLSRKINRKGGDMTSATMEAVRLYTATGVDGLRLERVAIPRPGADEALVRVHAAAITRDELEWPTDRLPAIPSFELSGVVVSTGEGVDDIAAEDAVFALTPFDRDGVAAEFAVVPVKTLAAKPQSLSDVEAAAIPMPALSAWQALFEHGRLVAGQRVLVHGAGGGVGAHAVQLARWRGAHVIGTASSATLGAARNAGADEVLGREAAFADVRDVDLVVDTVGGETLARSGSLVREGGKIVSIAEEPPEALNGIDAVYFVVRPDGQQLLEIARLVDAGELRPAVDSVFPLAEARAAFERSLTPGKNGKVVLRVLDA